MGRANRLLLAAGLVGIAVVSGWAGYYGGKTEERHHLQPRIERRDATISDLRGKLYGRVMVLEKQLRCAKKLAFAVRDASANPVVDSMESADCLSWYLSQLKSGSVP